MSKKQVDLNELQPVLHSLAFAAHTAILYFRCMELKVDDTLKADWFRAEHDVALERLVVSGNIEGVSTLMKDMSLDQIAEVVHHNLGTNMVNLAKFMIEQEEK